MICFEQENSVTIHDFGFDKGNLILVRNMSIEKALNWKICAQYFGPMIVVLHNKGGVYIICDLDGTLAHAPVVAF